jgi:hypothetical protein
VPSSDPGLNRSATERRPSDFKVVVKGFVKMLSAEYSVRKHCRTDISLLNRQNAWQVLLGDGERNMEFVFTK